MKSRGMKKATLYRARTNQKKSGVAILTSDIADFRAREVLRDKESDLKWVIHHEHLTVLNVYVLKNYEIE